MTKEYRAGGVSMASGLRHFLVDTDLTPEEQGEVLDLALRMKSAPYAYRPFEGPQTVAVIFDKTSTRTRFSFAAGIAELGGSPLVVNPGESQLGHKESIADTARAMSRMVSTIVWRTFAQSGLEEMAAYSRVPVINALSDVYHPCQGLADLLTVRENFGRLSGMHLAYLGDGSNNMAQSYLLGGATAGMHVRIASPDGYVPAPEVLDAARKRAEQTGGSVVVTHHPAEAVADADVVTTDTWVSMGQEEQKQQRSTLFLPYQVDQEVMDAAAENAIFLHCLPAYRGYEVSAEVLDGPSSRVWDEAENRVHAQKALMTWLMAVSSGSRG